MLAVRALTQAVATVKSQDNLTFELSEIFKITGVKSKGLFS